MRTSLVEAGEKIADGNSKEAPTPEMVKALVFELKAHRERSKEYAERFFEALDVIGRLDQVLREALITDKKPEVLLAVASNG